jgi:hypothetical protein
MGSSVAVGLAEGVVRDGLLEFFGSSDVSDLLGNGDGSFQPQVRVSWSFNRRETR